ncbi:MAG: 3-keto-disaccharide hydrolase, partial [Bacteroidales bacterium]
MKKVLFFVIAILGCITMQAQVKADANDNKLTKEEVRDGWILLFDGQTTNGWKSAKAPTFPKGGWEVV